MRYDKTVYFVKKGERVRLPNGDYSTSKPTKTKRKANVTDMGLSSKELYFRDVRADGIVVRIQNGYQEKFDYIEIDGRKWQVIATNILRRDTAFKCGVFNG